MNGHTGYFRLISCWKHVPRSDSFHVGEYARATEALNALKIEHYTANPARFIHEASSRIREIELDELLRGLTYAPSGEEFDISRLEPSIVTYADTIETPNRGLYDRVVFDSYVERAFAGLADNDDEVVCFLKLPGFYQIPTPIGPYNPDFGVVLRRKRLRDGEDPEYADSGECRSIRSDCRHSRRSTQSCRPNDQQRDGGRILADRT